jgi:hypothetical protein
MIVSIEAYLDHSTSVEAKRSIFYVIHLLCNNEDGSHQSDRYGKLKYNQAFPDHISTPALRKISFQCDSGVERG